MVQVGLSVSLLSAKVVKLFLVIYLLVGVFSRGFLAGDFPPTLKKFPQSLTCLLYTSDAADE